MTINLYPNTFMYGTTGSTPTQSLNRSTILGDSNTPMYSTRANVLAAGPKLTTGIAIAATSGGTFAYKQTNEIIRGRAGTLNGVASTATLGGYVTDLKTHVARITTGAKTATSIRAGYWRPTGISGQRTNWSTAPAAASVTFAADEGMYVTYRLIPGEFTYRTGAPLPVNDDYPKITGAS